MVETLRRSLLVMVGCAAACVVVAGCGEELGSTSSAGSVQMMVNNQVTIPQPCMGASLTFFEGYTPVDIPYGATQPVTVKQPFGSGPYQIGFQVNGWYWRTCTSPGTCPNPNSCQNPDNAGQVGIQVAEDCSSAMLITNYDTFTCDNLVPNASSWVSVTLTSQSPCTVTVSAPGTPLTPTDSCCSCNNCSGSQIPMGQTPHCKA